MYETKLDYSEVVGIVDRRVGFDVISWADSVILLRFLAVDAESLIGITEEIAT